MIQLDYARANHNALRDRLLAEEPGLDEQTLADTLEGLTDLHEIVAAILRSAAIDESLAKGLRGRMAELEERLGRLEDRASVRRQIARDVMVEANIKKITAPDLTASLRAGVPGLVVTNEAEIPQSYWEPRQPRLNRAALLADLKRGEVAGACLSNPEPVISVRMK
jgi:hypothetical protein